MDGIEIRITLTAALHDAALDLCVQADVAVAQLMRDLLVQEVSRRATARRRPVRGRGEPLPGLNLRDDSDDVEVIERDWPPAAFCRSG